MRRTQGRVHHTHILGANLTMRRRSTETLTAPADDVPCSMPTKHGQRVLPSAPPLGPAAPPMKDAPPAAQIPEVPEIPVVPVVPTTPLRGGVEDGEFARPADRVFDPVASQEGIALYKHRGNQLRVALVPLSANQVVSITIVYLVGSNAEVTGMTGSAHILGKSYPPCKLLAFIKPTNTKISRTRAVQTVSRVQHLEATGRFRRAHQREHVQDADRISLHCACRAVRASASAGGAAPRRGAPDGLGHRDDGRAQRVRRLSGVA